MANPEHLAILKQGVEVWNKWRTLNYEIIPDLSKANLMASNLKEANLCRANLAKADLRNADLEKANLRRANLSRASLMASNLKEANLRRANLAKTDLSSADLEKANLRRANLPGAILFKAKLRRANLSRAKFRGVDLREAGLRGANLDKANFNASDLSKGDLSKALLVKTNFNDSDLTNSRVYGISTWDLKLKEVRQKDLIITDLRKPDITVDNLEVAQFVYLLLKNEKISDVIDTIGKKGVLILGRFTKKRKAVLDAIRNKLRKLGYVPVMFDFKKPTQRDFTETIKTLAGISRFIIADITNPKSSPLELQATMPDYMIPFVPIIQEDEEPFSMFRDLKQKYGEWVLDPLEYDTAQGLLDVFDKAVVEPAIEKAEELEVKKAEQIRTRHVKDYKKA